MADYDRDSRQRREWQAGQDRNTQDYGPNPPGRSAFGYTDYSRTNDSEHGVDEHAEDRSFRRSQNQQSDYGNQQYDRSRSDRDASGRYGEYRNSDYRNADRDSAYGSSAYRGGSDYRGARPDDRSRDFSPDPRDDSYRYASGEFMPPTSPFDLAWGFGPGPAYGEGQKRNRDYHNAYRGGSRQEHRGFLDRAGDELASWFGDDQAQARRDADHRERGEHSGRGPKGYKRSDSRINEDVSDRLSHDSWLDASNIEVKVSDGEVTLDGKVSSRDAKRRAERLAEDVSGVDHVQNNLRVDDNLWRNGSSTANAGPSTTIPPTQASLNRGKTDGNA